MVKKFFVLSFKNLTHRKLRSWLTIIGIIVGIALIVSLISLGKGLEQGISRMLEAFGGDLITIIPGEETDPQLGLIGGGSFRESDYEDLEDISGIDLVIPFEILYYPVEFKGEMKSTTIHGSPHKETKQIYTENRGLGLKAGKWPDREDTWEILLGSKIAEKKYREEIFVGDKVRIKGKEFKVVGILKELGSSEDDNAVYMSLENAQKISGKKGTARMLMVRVMEGFNQEKIADEIKYIMREERGSADFTVLTAGQTQDLVGDIIGTINLAVLFIAIFSIFVGAIGVMNTMYTSVLERRREIGIMKAIGATRGNILTIFIIESGIIGLFGGIIGTLIGLGLAKLAEIAALKSGFKFLEIYVSFEYIIGVLLFAFLLGVISGSLPARQASRMNPSEALRYE